MARAGKPIVDRPRRGCEKKNGLNIKFGFPPTDEGKAHKQTLCQVIAAIGDLSALHQVRFLPDLNLHGNWQMVSALSKTT